MNHHAIYTHLKSHISEVGVTQLVRFFVVEPIHPGSSSRLDTGTRIYGKLFFQ